MQRRKVYEDLLELFPDLKKEDAKKLSEYNEDFNTLITRVLDNNIENISIQSFTKISQPVFLNYPELVDFIPKRNYEEARSDASYFYEKSSLFKEKASQKKNGCSYYLEEAQKFYEKAVNLDREAVLILMHKQLKSRGSIDLHDFRVLEAVNFLEDLLISRKFTEISVIVGSSKFRTPKLKPAIFDFFSKKGFKVYEKGPVLNAKKIKNI